MPVAPSEPSAAQRPLAGLTHGVNKVTLCVTVPSSDYQPRPTHAAIFVR